MKLAAFFSVCSLTALVAPGCTPVGFGNVPTTRTLRIEIVHPQGEKPDDPVTGKPDKRLPITFSAPVHYEVNLTMMGADGHPDGSFNGWVRLSTKPGTILPQSNGPVHGRSVKLTEGTANNIGIDVVAGYGDTRVWAEDLGYEPTDPLGKPRCSDGEDNDNDGLIDFPADPGCTAADDDTENPGQFATGVSEPIYFAYPRIADVRGVQLGGTATPFPKEQVQIDTGYDRDRNVFKHSLVVTRLAPDGFYVTDIDDPRGYASVLAYTFNPPQKLTVCDRIVALSGTSADFFGFTELNFPAWSVEERICKPQDQGGACNRECMVPEPHVFAFEELGNQKRLLPWSAALVRVETANKTETRVGKHLGPGKPKTTDNVAYTFDDDASNCDFNANGKVDFTTPEEANCSNSCDSDAECSEWSSYAARGDFNLIVEVNDGAATPRRGKIQANASASADYDAVAVKGKPLRAFSGTLRYFSGGSQFTIEARCKDDIVEAGSEPQSSSTACVIPRLDTDNNAGTQ